MEPFITILIATISAIGGSYGTYYFAIRSKREEAKLKAKEEKYLALLLLLQGFVGRTSTNADTKRAFFREYYQAWLYSSDEVIVAIKQMLDAVRSQGANGDVPNGRELVGGIVHAMRKDLHGKTNLPKDTFEYIDVIESRT